MFSTLKNRTSDADKDSEESGSKTAEINYEYILPTISDANPKEAFAIRIESHITALELFNVSNSNPKKSKSSRIEPLRILCQHLRNREIKEPAFGLIVIWEQTSSKLFTRKEAGFFSYRPNSTQRLIKQLKSNAFREFQTTTKSILKQNNITTDHLVVHEDACSPQQKRIELDSLRQTISNEIGSYMADLDLMHRHRPALRVLRARVCDLTTIHQPIIYIISTWEKVYGRLIANPEASNLLFKNNATQSFILHLKHYCLAEEKCEQLSSWNPIASS